jgi:hypothetical protein
MQRPKHNLYHHPDQRTDLAKMRDQAYKLSRNDRYRKGVDVLVHLHKFVQPCEGHEHEKFSAQDNEVPEETTGED